MSVKGSIFQNSREIRTVTTLTRSDARNRYREILVLRVLQGLSQRETARKLGVSLSTVKRADAIRRAQGGDR